MKKYSVLISTIISVIITFIFAEIFSLYHFGNIPTLLTTLYLITIFSMFEYILLFILFIVKKKKNKQKIKRKEIFGRILLFIALLLIFGFIIVLNIDWLHWYAYSSPFYINVIVRSLEFILPAIINIIVGIVLLKNEK